MAKPHKTAADLINEVGPLLYDRDDWLEALAVMLGVKRETLRNIRRGNMMVTPDHGIIADLTALAERRAKETTKARDALKAWAKKNRGMKEGRAG